MKITSLDSVAKIVPDMAGAAGITKQIPISAADGSPMFSFRVFTFEPGGHTPYHTHPNEHLNYIIEGEGVLVSANGDEHKIKKGDFALVDPDEKHQYRNTSKDKTLVIICAVPKEYE
jgi:quercetin dioxygenase-like cupin family protein